MTKALVRRWTSSLTTHRGSTQRRALPTQASWPLGPLAPPSSRQREAPRPLRLQTQPVNRRIFTSRTTTTATTGIRSLRRPSKQDIVTRRWQEAREEVATNLQSLSTRAAYPLRGNSWNTWGRAACTARVLTNFTARNFNICKVSNLKISPRSWSKTILSLTTQSLTSKKRALRRLARGLIVRILALRTKIS